MSSLLTAARGAARTFARTAGALALDAANGSLRAVEAVGDKVRGRESTPGVLRVHVVILSDANGPLCRPEDVRPALDRAGEVLEAEAGIRVRITGVDVITAPAPPEALDPRANRGLLLDDILGRTSFYLDHLPQRVLGLVGAPVTVVVVREISGRTTGCSLGISADWVITQASLYDRAAEHSYDETVLAHELGHALNLPHHRDRGNLMFPVSSPPKDLRGTALSGWQAAILQASRHVVPGVGRDTPAG
ncbi:matrixin family metalloprotease [Nakamurella sp. YIM 132087]|uniref:Matrixin family metalloprotease n=1 Tax=Nakamurella alba TaxID=2665158 RepID=A0A7K1FKK9_9ACTN|nr:matrixin family metalloprotease [Nakamurella alba]MTD13939.1 matrixin family metalloprotease [Nakamurella alba]